MAMPAGERPDFPLAQAAEQVEVPEGYRVEIVDGSILVSPTPSAQHVRIIWQLEGALREHAPAGMAAVQMLTIELAPTGERYVPDLVVVPVEVLSGPGWVRSAADAELSVEVASPANAGVDRVTKVRGYAVAGVPLYLLIDPPERSVTLFSDPHDGVYRSHVQVPFGKTVELPEPFGFALETTDFD